ncbi:MAG: hypothetical protein LBC74_00900 [Planctomycetaceae bacterium]|nr:hypothetical protein [Planctomycetaceae bacterium]
MSGKRNTWGRDNIRSGEYDETPYSQCKFTWLIPWRFKCDTNEKNFVTIPQIELIDKKGDMTIIKGEESVSAKYDDPSSIHK